MEFVRQHTCIPVPRVFKAYRAEDGTEHLVMEHIEGMDLDRAWNDSMPRAHKQAIVQQLAGYVAQLRSLEPPKPGCVGSLNGAPIADGRLGARYVGTFPSVELFHRFVRRNTPLTVWEHQHSVTKVHGRGKEYRTTFMHADLGPQNVMVKNRRITAIIDWESSGWSPEYWEYIKVYFGWRPYRADFYPMVDCAFDA